MNQPTRPDYSTDTALFEALKQRHDRAYQHLYAVCLPSFRHWVRQNNGTDTDAEDMFQKGMMSFLLNIEQGSYQLQAGTRITTVLFEYCKRLWLTELQSARKRYHADLPEPVHLTDTTDLSADLERIETVAQVRLALSQLRDGCRQLLEWFYVEELSLREIAERMNMKETSVKTKRYLCAEKLKAIFQKLVNPSQP